MSQHYSSSVADAQGPSCPSAPNFAAYTAHLRARFLIHRFINSLLNHWVIRTR